MALRFLADHTRLAKTAPPFLQKPQKEWATRHAPKVFYSLSHAASALRSSMYASMSMYSEGSKFSGSISP